MTDDDGAVHWFSVRCVFESGWPAHVAEAGAYEERITLWRATSAEKAIERAEAEAREYAATIEDAPDAYLDFAQSYELANEVGDGAEVFSLIRSSSLPPTRYLDAYFDTGNEFQQTDRSDEATRGEQG